jgi:hypothetical protein
LNGRTSQPIAVRNFKYWYTGFVERLSDFAHLFAGKLMAHGMRTISKCCIGKAGSFHPLFS